MPSCHQRHGENIIHFIIHLGEGTLQSVFEFFSRDSAVKEKMLDIVAFVYMCIFIAGFFHFFFGSDMSFLFYTLLICNIFHYFIISLFYYFIILLFHYFTISLFHYFIVSLFYYFTISLYHYYMVILSRRPIHTAATNNEALIMLC